MILFRTTEFPTAFGTAKPSRGSPIVSSRAYHQRVRNRVDVDRPWRYTASKSRERERRFRRCTEATPTGARGPWPGGASRSAGRPSSTCAHGSRACGSACVRSADRSVSWRPKRRNEPTNCRPRASIAGPLDRSVVHSPVAVEKPWKAPPRGRLHTHFPQVWRPCGRSRKSLQIAAIGPCGHAEKSSLRRLPHAAMLANPEARERSETRSWSDRWS